MIRLNEPEYNCEETVDECLNGITGNPDLRQKLADSKPELLTVGEHYTEAAITGELHTIEPINNTAEFPDPVAVNTLIKSDLIKICDQYLVAQKKPARKIYDALLNAAKERCPFCGGIGTPRNLDHFLPKTHFPQFAILPYNLVPACRDCNMDGKAQAYATNAEDQIIQPYIDDDKFFSEQWIYASYNLAPNGSPGEFEYFVVPPNTWSGIERQRVQKHFEDFNIAKRYATKAAEQLGTILTQINFLRQLGIGDQEIITDFLQLGIDTAPFINHWQHAMYQALIDSL